MMQPATEPCVKHAPIEVHWSGAQRFTGGRPGAPAVQIDADAVSAQSPVDLLLCAIASCAATDVVSILRKQRTPVRELVVQVEALRVASTPRRLTAVNLRFVIRGPGISAIKAHRAIELSVEKYCSVRSSLRKDISVTTELDLAQ